MKTNKFRVWDKLAERFIRPDEGFQGHYTLDLNGCFYDLGNGSGGDEYVVQQYIGANDKNKNPIHEGDIVARSFHSGGKEIFQVIWDDFYCGFAFALKDGRGLNHTGFKLLNGPHGNENYEVIGNIFENPELLK